jgi:hypothetical protein
MRFLYFMVLSVLPLAACNRSVMSVGSDVKVNEKAQPRCTIAALEQSWPSDIVATLRIENPTPKPFRLMKWNLGENGRVDEPIFAVSKDNQRIPYRGIIATYIPVEDSYIVLQPGQSATTSLRLRQSYDVSSPGSYQIRYESWNPQSDGTTLYIASEIVTVQKK